jgi:hypothetical protein
MKATRVQTSSSSPLRLATSRDVARTRLIDDAAPIPFGIRESR